MDQNPKPPQSLCQLSTGGTAAVELRLLIRTRYDRFATHWRITIDDVPLFTLVVTIIAAVTYLNWLWRSRDDRDPFGIVHQRLSNEPAFVIISIFSTTSTVAAFRAFRDNRDTTTVCAAWL